MSSVDVIQLAVFLFLRRFLSTPLNRQVIRPLHYLPEENRLQC